LCVATGCSLSHQHVIYGRHGRAFAQMTVSFNCRVKTSSSAVSPTASLSVSAKNQRSNQFMAVSILSIAAMASSWFPKRIRPFATWHNAFTRSHFSRKRLKSVAADAFRNVVEMVASSAITDVLVAVATFLWALFIGLQKGTSEQYCATHRYNDSPRWRQLRQYRKDEAGNHTPVVLHDSTTTRFSIHLPATAWSRSCPIQ